MFHKRLKQVREACNISHEQLAQTMRVSVSCVKQWEEPNSLAPSIEQLLCIAYHCNVAVDYLLGFSDQMRPDIRTSEEQSEGNARTGREAGAKAKKQKSGRKAPEPVTEVEYPAVSDAERARIAELNQPRRQSIPVSLLSKLCRLEPDELEMTEAFIDQLRDARGEYYIIN
ncbi:MAG: helix-turn-helix transcriptional regulator [Clostridia bacterium]|nr:helix-turn-helix transcriptional regulator [Clostridia bacterium]